MPDPDAAGQAIDCFQWLPAQTMSAGRHGTVPPVRSDTVPGDESVSASRQGRLWRGFLLLDVRASSARVTLIEACAPSLFVLGAAALAYISGRALAHCTLNARSGLAAASLLSRACVSEPTLARRPPPLMQPLPCPCVGCVGHFVK